MFVVRDAGERPDNWPPAGSAVLLKSRFRRYSERASVAPLASRDAGRDDREDELGDLFEELPRLAPLRFAVNRPSPRQRLVVPSAPGRSRTRPGRPRRAI